MSVARFLHDYKHMLKNDLIQSPFDPDLKYPRTGSLFAAILHFFCGAFSIALGVGAICTNATGYFIGYGIWCGFLFILAGVFALVSCCCSNTCQIVTNMVFSILATCAAITQFSLGVVAAANDGGSSNYGRLSAAVLDNVDRFDIIYSKQVQQALCAGRSDVNWSTAWGPVDVLLIIVAFIEILVAVASSIFSCCSMCCGMVQVPVNRALPIISLNSDGEVVGFDSSASYVDYSRA